MSVTEGRGNPPAAGTPAGWVEPELATLTHERCSGEGWLYERKFDGERCLAIRRGGRVSLLTRNRQQVNGTYPELAEALAAQEAGDFLVDGEVVAFAGSSRSSSARWRSASGPARASCAIPGTWACAGTRTRPR